MEKEARRKLGKEMNEMGGIYCMCFCICLTAI